MKVSFTPDELAWIRANSDHVAMSAADAGEQKLANRAKRIAYKTTPNALHVFFNRAERAVLLQMAEFRMKALEQDLMNPGAKHEQEIILGLARRLIREDSNASA
jgi:hypothetical protein